MGNGTASALCSGHTEVHLEPSELSGSLPTSRPPKIESCRKSTTEPSPGLSHSWVFALWVFIAMLVGGSQVGGDMGRDIGIAFLFWVLVAGCEGLAWFLAPRATKFYKWSEEDWWNYDGEEVPKVWPSQLGDFVAY